MNKADRFLEGFFRPSSVAIVGATNNFLKMNFRLVQNLVNLNFMGTIYPVNPREGKILGKRAFARLREIPGRIDLVVIAVPAPKTLGIVEDCVKKGVKHVVRQDKKPTTLNAKNLQSIMDFNFPFCITLN